ncbi:ABC transporter permease [Pasteuria penetrans]|uniref:ABC transporter permease n=1 Tax=Pasteuria penetrans TaxID=86005 RepID=UPI0011EE2DB6|nr:ABC transporter permease [Pasteuria penetrans]
MTFFSCVVRMIQRRPQAYIGLLLNSMITSSVIFVFASFLFHPQLPLSRAFVENLFWITFYILVFCSFFSVFYSMATLYRERQKQFGTLILLGIKSRQLRIMLALETMIIGCFSVLWGVAFGMVVNGGLGFLIESLFEYIALDFHFSFEALGITVASSLAIFLLAALVMPFLVRNRKVIQLLQSKRRMDDKPEPPVGFLRVLVSFLSLGIVVTICLFLPVDMNIGFDKFPDSLQYIFPFCVLLTFVGAYFFYRQGSVALARWFRWNRSFSWRGIRLLWIGNMAHRLRDNSRFFWFFSMLLLSVFLSTSVVVALVKGVTEFTAGVEKQNPAPAPLFIYRLGEEDRISPEAQGRSQRMDQILLHRDSGLKRVDSTPVVRLDKGNPVLIKNPMESGEYEKYERLQSKKAEALAKGDRSFLEGHTEFLTISVGDYNRVMEAYGGALLRSLKPNEAVALGSKQGAALNPLPRGLGAAEVTIPSLEKQPAPVCPPSGCFMRGSRIGMYVVGDKVYSKLLDSRDPSIRKFRDANYMSGQGKMNPQIFQALGKANSLHSNDPNNSPEMMGSVIHDGSQKYQDKLIIAIFLFAMLIVCLVFVSIAGNFLLLRIYTDMEDQQQQFHNLLRIGFSIPNLRRSITVQIAYVFFFPLLLAVFLASCALYYGVRFTGLSVSLEMGEEIGREIGDKISSVTLFSSLQVMAVFLGVQMIMFLLARLWILRTMEKRTTG